MRVKKIVIEELSKKELVETYGGANLKLVYKNGKLVIVAYPD